MYPNETALSITKQRFLCRNPNASNMEMISVSGKIYERARLDLVSSFMELGFEQVAHYYDAGNATHHYKLLPCPEGTYSLKSQGCKKCPPGSISLLYKGNNFKIS